MKTLNIQSQVILLAITPLIITIVVLSFFFISERIEDSNIALQEKSEAIITQLSKSAEFGLFAENISYLEKISRLTLQDNDVYSIKIYNKNGDELVNIQNLTSAVKDKDIIVSVRDIYSSTLDIDEYHKSNKDTSKYLGKVVLKLTKLNTKSRQASIIINSFLLVIFALIATSIIAAHLARGITSPILKLSKAMHAIKNGLFDHNLNLNASGEIAVLEKGLKEMTTSLIEARKREKEIAEQIIFLEKTKAQITLEAIGEGVITTNKHGYIAYINPAAENLLQTKLDEIEGLPLSKAFKIQQPDEDVAYIYPYKACLTDGQEISHNHPIKLIRQNGTSILIKDTANPIYDRNGEITGLVLVFHDITTNRTLSGKILIHTEYDKLTGIIHQDEFEVRSRIILSESHEEDAHNLCLIDIDNFKQFNDTYGHQAGDEFLISVSRILQESLRKNDLVARFGADEFAILFRDCPEHKAHMLTQTLLHNIQNLNNNWKSISGNISASAGLVNLHKSNNIKKIIEIAYTACNTAKHQGGNTITQINSDTFPAVIHSKKSENANNPAADSQESLFLFARRIIPIRASQATVNSYDVYAGRYNQHTKDSQDVQSANQVSIKNQSWVDRWVLQHIFELLSKHPNDASFPNININLSEKALLDSEILEEIIQLVETRAISYQNITFEFTERSIMTNHESTVRLMKKLQKLGFQFALTDFGAGLCSLELLKETPVNSLKICTRLVNSIKNDNVNLALLNAINHVAHALGIKTIANNVSDPQVISILQNTDVDYIYGSPDQPPIPFEDLLNERNQSLG